MKDIFNEYQSTLLKLANDPYFRKYLQIAHVPEDKKIELVLPNGVVYRNKKDYSWLFWGKDVIANAVYDNLGDIYKFGQNLKLPNTFEYLNRHKYAWLDNTFTSGAGDGYIGEADAVWATARNATSGNQGVDYTATTLRLSAIYNGANYFIYRGRVVFDTSALDDAASITSGSLRLNNDSIEAAPYNESGGYWLVNVASALASFTTLTGNDFDNFGTTLHSDSSISSNATGLNTIALNAAGISAISKTSFTDWGLRLNRDYANSSPGGTLGQQLFVSTSEHGTAGNRPLLTVVTPSLTGFLGMGQLS